MAHGWSAGYNIDVWLNLPIGEMSWGIVQKQKNSQQPIAFVVLPSIHTAAIAPIRLGSLCIAMNCEHVKPAARA
jgi:hypothetical protein